MSFLHRSGVVGSVKHQHGRHCLDLLYMCFPLLMIITVGCCEFKLTEESDISVSQFKDLKQFKKIS